MKKYIFFLLFFSTNIYSQKSITSNGLSFHNEVEKAAFSSQLTNFDDRFALLLCVNSTIDNQKINAYKEQLNLFYKKLEEKKIRAKSTKKATKIIFKMAHKALLKNYETFAQVNQIFDDGTYNCLTATILFSLIFDHFDIDYQVKELPTHVYIIVEPNGINLTMETTDSSNGLYKVDKHTMINDLEQLQIISKQESRSHTVDELYKKYSVGEEQIISYKELAADLYYNTAIINYEAGKYEVAHRLIDKGLFLYPKRQANFTRISIIYQLTLAVDLMRPESLQPLFILLKNDRYSRVVQTDLVNNLRFAAQKFLVENDNQSAYEAIRTYIQINLPKSKYNDLDKSLEETHFICFGYYKSLKNDYDTAIEYLKKAYQIAPENLRVKAMLVEAIIGKEQLTRVSDLYEILMSYTSQYPFLTEFDDFNYQLILGLSGQVATHFNKNEEKLGFKKLNEFMSKLNQTTPNESLIQRAISIAYAPIHSYYVRKSDYENAKFWIKKGLQLAPKSKTLNRKKAVFRTFIAENK
jgi:tetratricopeptide (TPR) repeat protein